MLVAAWGVPIWARFACPAAIREKPEGIRRVLELENENRALRDRVRELERALADQLISRPGARVFAATTTGAAVPLRAGVRPQRNTAVVLYRPARRATDG